MFDEELIGGAGAGVPSGHEPHGEAAGMPALAEVLASVDVAALTAGEAVDAVAAWGRVVAWAQAQQARAAAHVETTMVELDGPTTEGRLQSLSREPKARRSLVPRTATEVAMRLGISRQSAARMIRVGLLLDGPLSATGEAVERGDLCWRKAEVIATGLDGLALPVILEVEDAVLPGAPGRTPSQLREQVARAVSAADPQGSVERHRSARAGRRVCHPRALPDGMAQMTAVLPAADAIALDRALDGAARRARAGGDARTTDQLRADVLAAVGFSALPFPSSGSRGAPVRVDVTVSASTLAGLDDEPGHLDGYGAIDAATARALAAEGTWRRLLTAPRSGVVIDVGRERYRPPASLARLVRARDGTCTRPGCGVRASACELDHVIPFAHGGTTALGNLASLCSTDHRLKTNGHFRVSRGTDGTLDWTSPSGHTYRRHADGTTRHLGRTKRPPAETRAVAVGPRALGLAGAGRSGVDPPS